MLREFVVPSGMPAAVFHDKYSRKKEDGSYQTWRERVTEMVDGNISLRPESKWQREMLLNYAVAGILPFSGRHLQHGDITQAYNQGEKFLNCTSAMFSWASFLLLMKGCGVGRDFSGDICYVDWDYTPNCRFVLDAPDNGGKGGHPDYEPWIETLDEARQKYDTESESVRWYEVDDSAEGWAKVVMIMETAAFHKHNKDTVFVFDFSKVRRAGAPLMGQQGRPASGPVPFIRALHRVMSIKGAGMKPWKQALFIDHYLAECVVVGGVRRAARIAVKSCDDRDIIEFIDVKRGGLLWSANNTVLVHKAFWESARNPRPSHYRRVFEAAAGSSYWDDTGEPAFFNQDMVNDAVEDLDMVTADTYLSPSFIERIGGLHSRTYDMIAYHLERAKRKKYRFIPNPCVTSDTMVLTALGPKRVRELVGKPFTAIVNGKGYAASGFWKTGTKPIVEVTTDRGYRLRLTANHRLMVERQRRKKFGAGAGYDIDTEWVEAGDLKTGDKLVLQDHRSFSWEGDGTFHQGWLVGEIVGDGGHNPDSYESYVKFWGDQREDMAEFALTLAKALPEVASPVPLHKFRTTADTTMVRCKALSILASEFILPMTKTPLVDRIASQGSVFVCGFLRGLFDADGTVLCNHEKGRSIRLSQSNLLTLKAAQKLLLNIGIPSTIYENRREAGERLLPDGHGGRRLYPHDAQHELVISRSSMAVFMDRVGFYDEAKASKAFDALDTIERGLYRESFTAKVVGIEDVGTEDVYDCNVAEVHAFDANGLMAHNCGEVPMAVWGAYCDVGDECLAQCQSVAEALSAIGYLACALVRVNTMDFIYSAEVRRTNRIGVSLTGIHEFMWRVFGLTFFDAISGCGRAGEFWNFIDMLRCTVEQQANKEAEACGLRHPVTHTVIKPSGTVSKVEACTEGAHLPPQRHYLRWVMHHEQAALEMQNKGYPIKDVSHQYPGTYVVGFPTCLAIVEEMGQKLVTASEANPAAQYRWLQLLEQHWLGPDRRNGQVSYTLKWKKSLVTYEDYINILLDLQPTVRCCTLMPDMEQDESAYAYLPEEPITASRYYELLGKIQGVEMEAYDKDSLMCEGGACPIEMDINVREAAN